MQDANVAVGCSKEERAAPESITLCEYDAIGNDPVSGTTAADATTATAATAAADATTTATARQTS